MQRRYMFYRYRQVRWQIRLIVRSCPDGFTIGAKNQHIIRMVIFEIVNCICIITTEDLLEEILAHVAIAFKIGDQEFYFFPGSGDLFRGPTEFDLRPAGKNF